MVYTSFWLCFGASRDTWYTSFLLGVLGILRSFRGLHWGILAILRSFWASSGILGILGFGFVLEPPGIVGIFPSFWGYLLYFVPFGASLGDTWYISVLWGLHLAHLVYTSFWLCFEAPGDTWYTPFLLGYTWYTWAFIWYTWYILCGSFFIRPRPKKRSSEFSRLKIIV